MPEIEPDGSLGMADTTCSYEIQVRQACDTKRCTDSFQRDLVPLPFYFHKVSLLGNSRFLSRKFPFPDGGTLVSYRGNFCFLQGETVIGWLLVFINMLF